ncbi:MAG TPA: alpha-ketoacid dehydrogenase subunit beta [Candidatus Dormibacteraeota bacterium]|nr:alpha-ketoacid dehydrogenase subunit beta [Candidatus Dormibacteraeota bacterium]
MGEMTYRQAIGKAIADELSFDPDVFLMGEDVAAAGGVFKTTEGLLETFGAVRIRDTPISEQALVGCALGAAIMGLRPVVEIMFADFAGVCFDQIANQLAKYRYLSGGQSSVPVTLRLSNGAGLGFGAQHSQPVENWFLNIPGLKIVTPSTVADMYGLLRSAIRDANPVLVFEHKGLHSLRGSVDRALVPIGRASTVRDGEAVTVVATQLMLHRALAVAQSLGDEGISAEVIDLRTLVPMDVESVAKSVERTSRLVCVQEGPLGGGWAASLVSEIVRSHFYHLEAPPRIVASDPIPVPYAKNLEDSWLPSEERIRAALRASVADTA